MTSVFLSYSRTDQPFVRRLYDALAGAGRDAWVDWHDIPPTAEWLNEVYAGLDHADAVICVLSPEWAASEVSQKELAHALEARKRIIPVVCREVAPDQLAAPVRALNWIFFRPTDDFDTAFKQLLFALDTDLDYWHQASRLLVRAQEWEQSHERRSAVLRGKELAGAERWLAEGAEKQPAPTALQTRYITASRRASGARQRTWIGLLSAGLLITLALAAVARIEQARADSNAQQVRAQNKVLFAQVLAGEANADLVSGTVDQAMLLSVAATRRLDSLETRNALLSALEDSPHLATTLYSPADGTTDLGEGISVAFTSDGKTILAANAPDTNGGPGTSISLWDAASHQLRRRFTVPGPVAQVAFSGDGRLASAVALGSGVQLWDVTTGTLVAQLSPRVPGLNDIEAGAYDLAQASSAFSPDGQVLAAGHCDSVTCAHPTIALWDTHSHAALGNLPLTFPPNALSLAFSPDGTRLADVECDFVSTNRTCQLELWNWAQRTRVYTQSIAPLEGGGYNIFAVAFSPDGKTLATAGCADVNCAAGQIVLWDAATGLENGIPLTTAGHQPVTMAFGPDGRTLAVGDIDGTIHLWDVASRQSAAAPWQGHQNDVEWVAFSPDGHSFATGGKDGRILLWHVGAYTASSLPAGPNLDGNSQVAISPDSHTLATGGCDGHVRLWDSASGTLRATLSLPAADVDAGACAVSLAFSHDGAQLVVGTDVGAILIWNSQTQQLVSNCQCSDGAVEQVALSPDGKALAANVLSYQDSSVKLINVATQSIIQSFTVPLAITPLGMAFSPDGAQLALGGAGPRDRGITLWNLRAGVVDATLPEASEVVGALAFSPDGRVLAALSGDRQLKLWNTQTHQVLASLGGQQTEVARLSVAFSPDGRLLATGLDANISLWDVHDPTHLALYTRQIVEPRFVLNLVFSPDGKWLLDAVEEGPVNVRYATLAGWQSAACAIANRNFTQAEWQQFFGAQPDEPYQRVCPGM